MDIYYWILVLPTALLALWAQARVSSAYRKYSRVANSREITGNQAAQMILRGAGIYDVSVQPVSGELTDHYDPKNKVLRLSDGVYGSISVAAVGIAAHEAGHAIQHHEGYAPLRLRNSIIPITRIGSQLSWPLIIIGLLLGGASQTTEIGWLLIQIGLIAFAVCVVFQLLTLPVEFNASARAMKQLENGILTSDELPMARKVLSAAAMTYVAAMASALANFLRLLLLFGGGRRDRD